MPPLSSAPSDQHGLGRASGRVEQATNIGGQAIRRRAVGETLIAASRRVRFGAAILVRRGSDERRASSDRRLR